MSKQQELIQKLCPYGVEYKKISECFDVYNGMTGVSLKWKESGNCKFIDYLNTYQNLKIDVSKKPFATVKNLNQNTVRQTDILLTTASEVPEECAISSVVEDEIEDNVFLDDHLFGLHLKEEYKGLVNTTYINYYMKTPAFKRDVKKKVKGVTRFFVSPAGIASIEIPVPPLEVQEEIVRILDNFTNLAAELQAELQARQEQYEYYRNKLLTFNNVDRGGYTSVTWMKMSEIFEMKNGYTPSKAVTEYWENGIIPWFRMEDIRKNGRILSDSILHITPQAVKGGKLFHANSIILATTATIGEHALIIADSLANQQFTNLSIRKSLSNALDMKYFYYYMFVIDDWCRNNTNVSGFASVDMRKLKNLLIPIPPLAEQKRIVSILDKFDALVNDLSHGLPAEIAAVQEQYEYYRNKLLSFPRTKISA